MPDLYSFRSQIQFPYLNYQSWEIPENLLVNYARFLSKMKFHKLSISPIMHLARALELQQLKSTKAWYKKFLGQNKMLSGSSGYQECNRGLVTRTRKWRSEAAEWEKELSITFQLSFFAKFSLSCYFGAVWQRPSGTVKGRALALVDLTPKPFFLKWDTYNLSNSSFRSLQSPSEVSMCLTTSSTKGLTKSIKALQQWQRPCMSSCSCCAV